MGTPAGIWLRVSDESQDENNQLPDIEAYCREHGYDVRRTFRVHGRSAWKKGRLDADKQAVLGAVRSGEISVVVVWSVDRWSRGGIADLLEGLGQVKQVGGRVEFVKDEALNVPGPAQELLLAVLGWVAAWESRHRSDRTKNGMERERANGKIMGGRVPFGYRIAGGRRERDEKALAAVAELFERSARGESTSVMGDWLRRSGYRRQDNTIRDLFANPLYVADGVVSASLAKAALDGLESRRSGTVRRTSEEDYSAVLRCRCGLPLYRIMAGGNNKNGPTRYYRCRDGEHEKGRVPMVRGDDADRLVEHVMRADWWPYMVPVRTGGDTREADVARLRKKLAGAVTRAETDAIWDEIEKVRASEPEPEVVEWAESGETRGQHWARLTIAERRAWLESEGTRIVAWNEKDHAGLDIAVVDHAWALARVRLVVEHGELSVALQRPRQDHQGPK
jgi:DNA invertase Pin-like site-specific DNA recombinase